MKRIFPQRRKGGKKVAKKFNFASFFAPLRLCGKFSLLPERSRGCVVVLL